MAMPRLQDHIIPPNWATDLTALPDGFIPFLHLFVERFTSWQQHFVGYRGDVLAAAHGGRMPTYPKKRGGRTWRVRLPDWCTDQRNQMTGPADDAALAVKMMNSGSPGVMIDFEDSGRNDWDTLMRGHRNAVEAVCRRLKYRDYKKGCTVGIGQSSTVLWTRVRGLHLHQYGLGPLLGMTEDAPIPAALFDVALHCFMVANCGSVETLNHPLCFYIPKTEGYEEADWWEQLFSAMEEALGWKAGFIKCMALVESLPMAYGCEEFARRLKRRILGLNFGRWDYLASLIHFTEALPEWKLMNRNDIPHNAPFLQQVRRHMVNVCHRHGILAIGGMTALYPDRQDPEFNATALEALRVDKQNEAAMGCDGAWTGHPDQNDIAVAQFPAPNQLDFVHEGVDHPDLLVLPETMAEPTETGTIQSIRAAILYRAGVLAGRGATLLFGRMEDLATDRICRAECGRRIRHKTLLVDGDGALVPLTEERFVVLLDEVLNDLLENPPQRVPRSLLPHIVTAGYMTRDLVLSRQLDPH